MSASPEGRLASLRLGRTLFLLLFPLATVLAIATGFASEAFFRATALPDEVPTGREQSIVVLTGNLTRLHAATAVQRRTGLPIILVGNGSDEFLHFSKALGAVVSHVEPNSMDTEENGAYGACLFRTIGVRSVFLVTEPVHGRRATAWLRHHGIETTFVGAPLPHRAGGSERRMIPNLGTWHQSRLLLHEWGGLAEYAVKRMIGVSKKCPTSGQRGEVASAYHARLPR